MGKKPEDHSFLLLKPNLGLASLKQKHYQILVLMIGLEMYASRLVSKVEVSFPDCKNALPCLSKP